MRSEQCCLIDGVRHEGNKQIKRPFFKRKIRHKKTQMVKVKSDKKLKEKDGNGKWQWPWAVKSLPPDRLVSAGKTNLLILEHKERETGGGGGGGGLVYLRESVLMDLGEAVSDPGLSGHLITVVCFSYNWSRFDSKSGRKKVRVSS